MVLDSWDNIYFHLPYLSQEFMVLSQLLILSWAFSYSLTKLQNYSLSESLLNSTEVPKCGKKHQQNRSINQQKIIKNSALKNHDRYIYWFIEYISGWVRFTSSDPLISPPSNSPSPHKGNSRFEILLVKIFSLKQWTKSNTSSYYSFTKNDLLLWYFLKILFKSFRRLL